MNKRPQDQDGSAMPTRSEAVGQSDVDYEAIPDKYFRDMTRRAKWVLGHLKRGVGNYEDAVQSALRTYLRSPERDNTPTVEKQDDIWKLLEHHLKRKTDKYRHQAQTAANAPFRSGDLSATEEVGWAALFIEKNTSKESVEQYIQQGMEVVRECIKDKELLEIATLRAQNYDVEEIANMLSISEHKVRRRLSAIRKILRTKIAGLK